MQWIVQELGADTCVNVMAQYHPAGRVGETEFPEINRCITQSEFRQVLDSFHAAGLARLDSDSMPLG